MKRLWRRFLAWSRLSLTAVCEESKGKGLVDYHDYPDGTAVKHYVTSYANGLAFVFHRVRRRVVRGYDYFCPRCGGVLTEDHGCMGDTAVCRQCDVDYGQLEGFPED